MVIFKKILAIEIQFIWPHTFEKNEVISFFKEKIVSDKISIIGITQMNLNHK